MLRNSVSGLLQIDCKLKKKQWHHNFMTWHNRRNFFGFVLFVLSSLVTGPSFMSISLLVLELWQFLFIRNWPEIWKSEKIMPNIWRLEQVKDTKFGMNFSNGMLLNVAKCQGYSFYCFWVIKEKPTWQCKIPPPHSTSILGLSIRT